MNTPLVQHLDSALQAAQPSALAVAFSGGLDSTALLHALAQLPQARAIGMRALHVHHGLHADATDWATRCAAACKAWQIPLHVLHCHVPTDSGNGIEAAARDARYAALAAATQPDEWLATAHHQEDQAETLLLRLLRGSGTAALGAMRDSRPLGPGTLWRPLLNLSRETLRTYAVANGLDWIDDSSNADPRFDRSWLRSTVMPLLTARWPHASAVIAQSAALLARDGDLIAEQTEHALDSCRSTYAPEALDIAKLLEVPLGLRSHVIRRWLATQGASPLPRHLLGLLQSEFIDARADAQPKLRYAETEIRRFKQRLYVLLAQNEFDQNWAVDWDGREPLCLPDGSQLEFSPVWTGEPLRVGFRQGGERIRLPGRTHSHPLKDVLQRLGIPPWQRAGLPMVWSRMGELLAVGEQISSESLVSREGEHASRLIWRKASANR